MNARLPLSDEPRLYSKPQRAPVDAVAPQHAQIHVELEAWGRWSREKYQPGTCDSIESRFDPGEGGRKVRPPTVSLPENDRHRQIDQVVRHMRMHLVQHGEALKMYYVGVLPDDRRRDPKRPVLMTQYIRCSPKAICRALHLHWSNFDNLMFDSRAALLNLLRRQA